MPGEGQQIKEMQFVNQPITDILLALAQVSGTSIIPDDTVSGSASYFFSAMDFETALRVFLATYKMYHRQGRRACTTCPASASPADAAARTVSLDAEDVDIAVLIRAVSRAVGPDHPVRPSARPDPHRALHRHHRSTSSWRSC